MTSKLDFAAALGEQLKAAGAQMRAMRTPKDDSPVAQTPDHPALDVSIETAPTATVTATPPAAADATVAVTPRDATVCSATRTTETVPTATATVAATVTNESSSSAAPDTRHSEADTTGNALKTAPNSGIPDGSRAAGSDEKIVTVTVTKTVTSDIPHAVPSPTREAERALSSTFPHATPESASPSPDAGGERRSGTAIPPSITSGAAPDPRNHAAAKPRHARPRCPSAPGAGACAGQFWICCTNWRRDRITCWSISNAWPRTWAFPTVPCATP